MTIIFGDIPGIKEGDSFSSRIELSRAGIHRPTQAGISGRTKSEPMGSESIVLSGGYEDDIFEGDLIVYTGAGGRDENTGRQIADQSFEGVNKALAISYERGLPIRVSKLFLEKGDRSYQYLGLYDIIDSKLKRGKSGYMICSFTLKRQNLPSLEFVEIEDSSVPARTKIVTNRIVRNQKFALEVKELYDYKCQICGTTIELPNCNYIEGAHIRALGEPHHGPDEKANLLALCPNHHIQFDRGALFIDDNFDLIGYEGKLLVKKGHGINIDYIKYHRSFRNK